MKTFKEFNKEAHISEGIGAAFKLGGKALAAYSAYKAGESLRQGKTKEAAINAIGAVPGGRVFKTIKSLGGAKNLAKTGSFAQSIARYSTDNPFGRTVNKIYDKGFEYAGKVYNKFKK